MSVVLIFLFAAVTSGVLADMGPIPSKEEQVEMLADVEDFIQQIKNVVVEEGEATDASVLSDTKAMANRAAGYLEIMEENAFLTLNCSRSANPECIKQLQQPIEELTRAGEQRLITCYEKTKASVSSNEKEVKAATDDLFGHVVELIENLNKCAKKPGFHQISCYKKAVSQLQPLKTKLVHVMEAHKQGHVETIVIRTKSQNCIDDALLSVRSELRDIFQTTGCGAVH